MLENGIDLRQIPEDWFEEIGEKPKNELSSINFDLYESMCSELLGNMAMNLYSDNDGNYFMKVQDQEPIGDYGHRWVDRWYKCIENGKLGEFLSDSEV